MDLHEILRKLRNERKKLDEVIANLERLYETPEAEKAAPKKRRGRKSMDDQARKEVSDRMKKYWASRREK